MTYYKFLRLKNGQVISDWDESVWERNEWRDIAIAPVLQAQGFYATERIADAVPWFGNVLAEVEVRGLSVAGNVVTAHQGMRITRAWKFSRQDWVDLAIHAAGLVLLIFESRFPDDKRPRAALQSGSAAAAARAAGEPRRSGPGRRDMRPVPPLRRRMPGRARRTPPPTPRWPSIQRTVPRTAYPLPCALMSATK